MKVKVHCGSGAVCGRARHYPYFIASLFKPSTLKDGTLIYKNSGMVVGPYRSIEKTKREAQQYANLHGYTFVDGYGSLHNQRIPKD